MGFCLCRTIGWWRKWSLWGSILLPVLLGMLKINSLGLLPVFIVLTMNVIEDSYGMNWLGCSIGGTSHGALGEVSTSLIFLARDLVKLVCVQLWGSP